MSVIPNVQLRPLSLQDAETVLAWRRDPAIAAQLFSERPPEVADHLRWVAGLEARTDRKEFVIIVNGGRRVGTIGLSGIDGSRGEAELGILIGDPEARGKGIARQASRLLLEYAFLELKLQTIVLRLYADNLKARRLYDRLGFREDATQAGEHTKNRVTRPTTLMRLERGAWRDRVSEPVSLHPETNANRHDGIRRD